MNEARLRGSLNPIFFFAKNLQLFIIFLFNSFFNFFQKEAKKTQKTVRMYENRKEAEIMAEKV